AEAGLCIAPHESGKPNAVNRAQAKSTKVPVAPRGVQGGGVSHPAKSRVMPANSGGSGVKDCAT
ncbi:MAG: hypothetical protein IKC82_02655, partial [Lentisphaeria bacterium]|nr:hypothetical protein [Lentisphaeria bacterium]